MKFSEDLAAIHGYLCSDGMVKQFGKHYQIKFTNIAPELLDDFRIRFTREFNIKPKFYQEGHIGRLLIYNKELFTHLIEFGPYDSRNWYLPFDFLNNKTAKLWLRAFFDAEAWVELQKAKSRAIRVDCINESGMKQLASLLGKFGIKSQLKVRKSNYIWRLNICGKDDLQKFKSGVGFLHQAKAKLLEEAVNSYKTYEWEIPKTKLEVLRFVKENGRIRQSRNELRLFSIKRDNLIRLRKVLKAYNLHSKLQGPWLNSLKRKYYCLILKEKEVEKL
jgi:hypothetical protein